MRQVTQVTRWQGARGEGDEEDEGKGEGKGKGEQSMYQLVQANRGQEDWILNIEFHL